MLVIGLKGLYNTHKFGQSSDINLWELIVFKFLKVVVIADYIGSSRCDSAINELVVVGVCRNQVKTIERRDTFHIRQ